MALGASHRFLRFEAALVACMVAASAAQAQIETPPMDMAGAMFSGQATRGILEGHLGAGRPQGPFRPGRTGAGSARPLAPDATRYRRYPAVTREAVERYLTFVAHSAPSQLAAVRDQLAHTDVEAAWGRQVASDGFRTGDAADAVAAYWLLNWVIANGRDNSGAQAAGVRAQVRAVLAATPRFRSLSERQRQELSETLMLNFLFQQSTYLVLNRRADRAGLERAAGAAAQRFRTQVGDDPRSLALTDAGFERRG